MAFEFNALAVLKLFKGHKRELFGALCLIVTAGLLYKRGINDIVAILVPAGFYLGYLVFECVGYYFQYQMKKLEIAKIEATEAKRVQSKAQKAVIRRSKNVQ
ncbi:MULTISPECIES: hypothetical protein [unclassified Shinella]|uniref:hypothetical protein n=1 Tax=unclassified Shinella TaxID=2643062 RepID=UPI00234E6E81|nr:MULTISPECIES: hypothetical protein [unclassified Shinella]MCO5153406.1 hypothetical protein [Shinella sp.]MDC7260585.1 hypothetical protein [Shinella sp. HY16]MDC7267480.1 hypothetical protein [Shinella sp. YZ44]